MGDEWTGSAFVTVHRHRALVEAYSGDMLPRVAKDISAAIKRLVPEATEMVFTRIKDGVERKGSIRMESKYQVKMQVIIDGKVRTELTQSFYDNMAELVRYEKAMMAAMGQLGDETAGGK
tara:strand:- start:1529 stop:1888 length:360 start_codon:yes stop_codon:yes gene_type:complete